MLGSPILDLAIGMAFIYLLLSLIASTMQEALAAIVQARSANLEHGIRSLFSGGELEEGKSFVEEIYRHGLIRGLYQDPPRDRRGTLSPAQAAVQTVGKTPVATPLATAPEQPGIVQSVKQDTVKMQTMIRQPSPLREALRNLLGVEPSLLSARVTSDPFLLPAYIPARTFSITLIDILNPTPGQGDPLANIEARLGNLCKDAVTLHKDCTNEAAQAILSLLADSKVVIGTEVAADKFRRNLENWYNDAMDRTSGWYKKFTQRILIVIGLTLAILFNVDSIRIGQTLWFDHDARQGLVSAASTYVQNNTPTVAGSSNATNPDATLSQQDLERRMLTTVNAFHNVSGKYLLPVGWRYPFATYKELAMHPADWNLIRILEQLLGWIITALALSFGAPFWFDTLNKFMVVRSTVKPQEKSLNEVSKS
jgi:hypothetical protein